MKPLLTMWRAVWSVPAFILLLALVAVYFIGGGRKPAGRLWRENVSI